MQDGSTTPGSQLEGSGGGRTVRSTRARPSGKDGPTLFVQLSLHPASSSRISVPHRKQYVTPAPRTSPKKTERGGVRGQNNLRVPVIGSIEIVPLQDFNDALIVTIESTLTADSITPFSSLERLCASF